MSKYYKAVFYKYWEDEDNCVEISVCTDKQKEYIERLVKTYGEYEGIFDFGMVEGCDLTTINEIAGYVRFIEVPEESYNELLDEFGTDNSALNFIVDVVDEWFIKTF